MAGDCGCRTWTGYRSEVPAGRTFAPLMEAGWHSRRRAVFPWYLLWLLPFLTSASTLLIILWSVSIIPTYVMWCLRTLGRPWGALPGWVMLLEYGCVAIAAAIIALRRIPQSPALQCSTE